MELSTYMDYLNSLHFSTNLPISLFRNKSLIGQSTHYITDFNLPMLLLECLPDELPDMWYTITPECLLFGGVSLAADKSYLCIGPVMTTSCTHIQAHNILSAIGRSNKDLPVMIQFFSKYSACDLTKLQASLNLVCYLTGKKEAPAIVELPFKWKKLFRSAEPKPEPSKPISPIEFKTELLSYIKYGRTDMLRKCLNNESVFQHMNSYQSESIDRVRSNLLGAVMLVSYVAEQSGLDNETSAHLMSTYQNQITRCSNLIDLNYLFKQMILDFAKCVEEIRTVHFSSAYAKKVALYINAHLYDKISTSVLAQYVTFFLYSTNENRGGLPAFGVYYTHIFANQFPTLFFFAKLFCICFSKTQRNHSRTIQKCYERTITIKT